jgi:ParB family chromosome partitioning protein
MEQTASLDDIRVDTDFNCRGAITPISVHELANNIRTAGLIEPVVVRPYDKDGFKYDLVAGFRRTQAFKNLRANEPEKYSEIPVVIKNVTLAEAKILNLIENIHREDLNILQEARALGS